IVRLGGVTIGRAIYQPGWRWSVDVGPAIGATSCQVEHVGMVVSGCATAAMDDGRIIEMRAGDIFYVPPGHDSWAGGDEPYQSLHFLGADDYAHKAKPGAQADVKGIRRSTMPSARRPNSCGGGGGAPTRRVKLGAPSEAEAGYVLSKSPPRLSPYDCDR